MFAKPRQERRFVEREGFGAVKMPARLLASRPAGMKYRRPLDAGNARKIELLEGRRRDRRNLRPARELGGTDATGLAKPVIGFDVVILQAEKLQGQLVEPAVVRVGMGDELAEARVEFVE